MIFFLYERKHKSPIIPFQMLKKPVIFWMIITAFLFLGCVALFGTSSFIPMFLQQKGFSIFTSGIALLGLAFGWMSESVPAGKWIIRFGYRPLLIIGNLLIVFSGLALLGLKQSTGFGYVFFAMIIQGLAFGLISTVQIIGVQQLVLPHERGVSTSIQMLSRNIGTVIGVTIMGAFLVKETDLYSGVHNLFVYGFIVSLFAFVSSFFIQDK